MRAAEFIEAALGTSPRRAQRSGARPSRGHKPVPRYKPIEEKIKGADGKACWDGYRYAGTKDGKDKCIPVDEQQLDELTFLGSPCTKDCSGHRAGYKWSKARGGVDAASWSQSFNNGAAIAKSGR